MNILTQSQGISDQHTAIAVHNVERAIRAIKTFTPHAGGIVPQSGGGTVKFLRADGTWAAPLGIDSSSVSGITNRLPKFTGPTSLGNSSVQDDGTTISTPELIVANGGFASHAASTIDASAATVPLSVNDAHTNQASTIVEVSIDSTGSSFAGATGGGGGSPPSFSGGGPGGANSVMLAANAVATVVSGSLTNIALYANAQHANTANYAIYAPHGDFNLVAGNTSLGGTLAVSGATALNNTAAVAQLLSANGGLAASNGPITLAPSNGGVPLTTTFGTPSPPSVQPAAILIQEADQNAANDASLVWWTIGGAPGTYNVFAGAKNTAGTPSNLAPKFVVGVQNAGSTGIANITERLSVTNAGLVVNGTADMGSNKILNLANGSAAQDGAAFGQIGSAVNAAVSGTANKVAKFTGTNVVGNSSITDDGTNVTLTEPAISNSSTAKAARLKLVGTDVLGTANTTDGPVLALGLNLANRKDFMVYDSTNTGPGAPALSISCGSAQGQYIQAVDIGWSAGQSLGIQTFGGALVIGNGSNNCTINSTTTVNAALTDSAAVGATITAAAFNADLSDTTATAQGVGGALRFRGNYSGGNTSAALIKAYKAIATTTDDGFDLVVATRANGSSDVAEQLRCLGAGGVSISGALNMNSHLINNVTDPSGAQDAATKNYVDTHIGLYLGRQVFTAASATYTPASGAKKVLLQGVGAGAGGGGGAGGSSVLGAGGGGSSGGWMCKFINPGATITGGAVVNAVGGTAGANTGGNGGAGGGGTVDASIVIQGVTYTFKSGAGGTGMAAANTNAFALGGAPVSGTTAGDYNTNGAPGTDGIRMTGPVGSGGVGGSSPYGGGGRGPAGASGAGTAATGFGAGGGGGVGGLTGNTGGAGSASIIIVDEWR